MLWPAKVAMVKVTIRHLAVDVHAATGHELLLACACVWTLGMLVAACLLLCDAYASKLGYSAQ